MQNKFLLPPGTSELIVRKGEAPANIEPQSFIFTGHISAPSEFYQKRKKANPEYFDPTKTVVVVDYENKRISLSHDPKHPTGDAIEGVMRGDERIKQFKINQSNAWRPSDLANFLRRNRQYFAEPEMAIRIVSELQTLKVKTTGEIEIADDKRGNTTQLFTQQTMTSIPVSFVLNMPIIAGGPARRFPVDIHFDVQGGSINISLESVDLIEIQENDVREAMDAEVEIFEGSGIPVLYK